MFSHLPLLIIILLINQVECKITPGRSNFKASNEESLPRAHLFQSVIPKKPSNIVSLIQFLNPPYLDLSLYGTTILPVIILSKATNIEVRDAIRRTWAYDQPSCGQNLTMKSFFLVGTDDYMVERIRSEQKLFDDVIQTSIPDMNAFLAYKELAALLWVRTHLPKSLFYFKTEEDVILNTAAICEQLISKIQRLAHQSVVIGWFGHEHVVRHRDYQTFLNAIHSPNSTTYQYAMNLFYSITSSAADRMLDALSHIDQIEKPGDIFLTGFLRHAAQIPIENLAVTPTEKKYVYDTSDGRCRIEFEQNSNLLLCTTSLHSGKVDSVVEYFDAWNTLISMH